MKKKMVIPFILSVLMTLIILWNPVDAKAEILTETSSGCTLTYDTDKETMTISGKGVFSPDRVNKPFGGRRIDTVIIEPGITEIGEFAFEGYDYLQTVILPNTITEIHPYAFHRCFMLKSVNFPEGIVSIGNNAFDQCSLQSITLPDSLTFIGAFSFARNNYLTNITIPKGIKTISDHAFWSCESIASVYIPDGVACIGSSTFQDCIALSDISIPDSVTTISRQAFFNCKSLSQIRIGSGVTEIGDYAFSKCYDLEKVIFNGTQAQWDAISIGGYNTKLTKATLVTLSKEPCKDSHQYKNTVTPPSCLEQGYTTHTCTICGYSYIDTSTNPIGHSFGGWEFKKEQGGRVYLRFGYCQNNNCSQETKIYIKKIEITSLPSQIIVYENPWDQTEVVGGEFVVTYSDGAQLTLPLSETDVLSNNWEASNPMTLIFSYDGISDTLSYSVTRMPAKSSTNLPVSNTQQSESKEDISNTENISSKEDVDSTEDTDSIEDTDSTEDTDSAEQLLTTNNDEANKGSSNMESGIDNTEDTDSLTKDRTATEKPNLTFLIIMVTAVGLIAVLSMMIIKAQKNKNVI